MPDPRNIPRDELEYTAAALQGYLTRVVRPVVLSPRKGTPLAGCKYGSGQVLAVGDRLVLLTAAHNLSGTKARETMDFVVGLSRTNKVQSEDIHWLTGERLVVWGRDLELTHEATQETRIADGDVAIVEVFPSEVEEYGFEPVSLDQLDLGDLQEHQFAIVVGFPAAMYNIKEVDEGRIHARWMAYVTVGTPTGDWHPDWHPRVHQVVRYDPGNSVRLTVDGEERLPDVPCGISGCAIWTAHYQEGRLFSYKDALLCGVQYAFWKDMLVGTNAHTVATMIATAFPDTKSIFQDLGLIVAEGKLHPAPPGPWSPKLG